MWWEFSPTLKQLCWNKEFRTCFRVKWFGFPKPFPKVKIGIHLQDMFNRHHGSISVIFQLIFNGISQKISLCHQDSSAPNAPKAGGPVFPGEAWLLKFKSKHAGGTQRWTDFCREILDVWLILSMTYASNWGLKKWAVAAIPSEYFSFFQKIIHQMILDVSRVPLSWCHDSTLKPFEYLWIGKLTSSLSSVGWPSFKALHRFDHWLNFLATWVHQKVVESWFWGPVSNRFESKNQF